MYYDGELFRLGDYVLVLKDIYRYPDGSGGLLAKAGEYMYIVAVTTSLAWDFGDQNVLPFQTDLTNTDYDFQELADDDEYFEDLDSYETIIDENYDAFDDKDTDFDYLRASVLDDENTPDLDCDYLPTIYDDPDSDEEVNDYDFVELAGDVDQDSYAPWNDQTYGIIYISETDYDEWDDDDSPYDFLRMAYQESTTGALFGLAPKKNQTPIGWASADMISLAKEE